MAPGECFLEAAWHSSGVTGVESEQARCAPDSASNLLCHLRGSLSLSELLFSYLSEGWAGLPEASASLDVPDLHPIHSLVLGALGLWSCCHVIVVF